MILRDAIRIIGREHPNTLIYVGSGQAFLSIGNADFVTENLEFKENLYKAKWKDRIHRLDLGIKKCDRDIAKANEKVKELETEKEKLDIQLGIEMLALTEEEKVKMNTFAEEMEKWKEEHKGNVLATYIHFKDKMPKPLDTKYYLDKCQKELGTHRRNILAIARRQNWYRYNIRLETGKEWKPILDRDVLDIYDKIQSPGKIVIIDGTEKGIAWDYEEFKRIGDFKV